MNRRNLLKGLGLLGVTSALTGRTARAAIAEAISKRESGGPGVCWLTPQETEGPYYFIANLFRQDIRTDSDTGQLHTGLLLNMTFTVIDINCSPIPNVLVDIWHCDKDGLYSGYVQPGGNTTGQDFMRGIQVTDALGQCMFLSSYPGWYQGRATHIHFKVRLTSTTYITSQFCFPDSTNNAVYATPLYSGRGMNPTTNATDSIFHNANPEYLVMDAAYNGTTGGYDGAYTIGVNGATAITTPVESTPTTFSLGQNYPNPFNPVTTVPYRIAESADVKLIVYDVLGREVATLVDRRQEAGDYTMVFDAENLPGGFYFYRLTAGAFMATREMLVLK